MIAIEDVGYSVKGKNILEGVSARIESGKITMVLGPNGAGKTTLIRILAGQISSTEGRVRIDGENLISIPKNKMAKIRAVLSQNTRMVFPLSVEEIVMMGRYPHFQGRPTSTDRVICREAMAFFNIDAFSNRNYLTLSGGEKQRVHFARVGAQIWPDAQDESKYLMLDEPLTYLDIFHQYGFLANLKTLMKRQSMTVVGVVHDLNLAYKFADEIILIHEGRVLAQGPTGEVLTKKNIKTAFRMEPSVLENESGESFLMF